MNINNIILPHVNIFSDKIVLSMGFCLGHVTEWGGGVLAEYQMTILLLMQTGTDRKISKTATGC